MRLKLYGSVRTESVSLFLTTKSGIFLVVFVFFVFIAFTVVIVVAVITFVVACNSIASLTLQVEIVVVDTDQEVLKICLILFKKAVRFVHAG